MRVDEFHNNVLWTADSTSVEVKSFAHFSEESFWGDLYVEIIIVVCLVFGCLLLSQRRKQKKHAVKKETLCEEVAPTKVPRMEQHLKHAAEPINAFARTGDRKKVLGMWRKMKDMVPLEDVLPAVIHAYMEESPTSLVAEMCSFLAHDHSFPKYSSTILDLIVDRRRLDVMEDFVAGVVKHMPLSHHMNEAIVRGYAFAGLSEKVRSQFEWMRKNGPPSRAAAAKDSDGTLRFVTSRAYSFAIRGLLHAGKSSEAVGYAKDMFVDGHKISKYLMTEIYHLCCSNGAGVAETLDMCLPELVPTCHSGVLLMEACCSCGDGKVARRLLAELKKNKVEIRIRCFEAYLKILVGDRSPEALSVLREVKSTHGIGSISEGARLTLFARATGNSYISFAKELAEGCRSAPGGLTANCFCALAKVYINANMHDEASSLVPEMLSAGLKPDRIVRTLIVRSTTDSGPESVMSAQTPAKLSPGLESATGQEVQPDASAAAKIDADMCTNRQVDKMLRVYSATNNMKGARNILDGVQSGTFKPNTIMFNMIINIAVNTGHVDEAWETVEKMSHYDARVDQYTISTMLKAARRTGREQDSQRSLDLLATVDVDVVGDEVLLTNVVENYMKFDVEIPLRETMGKFLSSNLKPGVRCYSILIRGGAHLKDMDLCRTLWHMMVETQSLVPNDIALGCMVKALVSESLLDEAYDLINAWKIHTSPNELTCTALLRAYCSAKKPQKAAEVVSTMRMSGIKPSAMHYNMVVESTIVGGDMTHAEAVLEAMDADGVRPDNYTLTLIVKGYCKKSHTTARALAAFEGMVKSSNTVDTIAYNTLLDGFIRHGQLGEAEKMVGRLEQLGVKPTNFTLSIILKLWGRTGNFERAFEAIETISTRFGIVPNLPVRCCLISACLKYARTENGVDWSTYCVVAQGCVRLGWYKESVRLLEEVSGLGSEKVEHQLQHIDPACLEIVVKGLERAGLMGTVGRPFLKRLKSIGIVPHRKFAPTSWQREY